MNLDLSQGVWYPLAIGALLFIICLYSARINRWRQTFITFGVVGYIAWMTDMITGVLLDLFDLGNPSIEGIGDIFSFGIIPSSLACIFVNYLNEKNRLVLTITFIVLSLAFEFGLVGVGYMKLKNWNTLLSLPVYILMFGVYLPLHKKYIAR